MQLNGPPAGLPAAGLPTDRIGAIVSTGAEGSDTAARLTLPPD